MAHGGEKQAFGFVGVLRLRQRAGELALRFVEIGHVDQGFQHIGEFAVDQDRVRAHQVVPLLQADVAVVPAPLDRIVRLLRLLPAKLRESPARALLRVDPEQGLRRIVQADQLQFRIEEENRNPDRIHDQELFVLAAFEPDAAQLPRHDDFDHMCGGPQELQVVFREFPHRRTRVVDDAQVAPELAVHADGGAVERVHIEPLRVTPPAAEVGDERSGTDSAPDAVV